MCMEAELTRHLELLLARFRERVDRAESTIGRFSAGDGDFFSRIRDGATFTTRKYDAVVVWFSENWPADAEWPTDVPRPEAADTGEAA